MLNKKIVILIAIVLFLTGLAVPVFYYYLKDKVDVAAPLNQTDSGKLCDQPAGRAKDLCLEQTALSQTNPEVCQRIDDANLRSDCFVNINLASALEKQDLAACEKLNDLMLVKTCLERIIALNYEKANCESLNQKELIIFCLSEKNGRLARKNNNAALCEKIPDGIKKANCLSELNHIDLHSDADKDGLDFLEEIINGTDPNNSDTNNNGIKDAAEVKLNINNQAADKNMVSCGEIDDKNLAGICLSELGPSGLNLFGCDKIKSPVLKDYCFNQSRSVLKSQIK